MWGCRAPPWTGARGREFPGVMASNAKVRAELWPAGIGVKRQTSNGSFSVLCQHQVDTALIQQRKRLLSGERRLTGESRSKAGSPSSDSSPTSRYRAPKQAGDTGVRSPRMLGGVVLAERSKSSAVSRHRCPFVDSCRLVCEVTPDGFWKGELSWPMTGRGALQIGLVCCTRAVLCTS